MQYTWQLALVLVPVYFKTLSLMLYLLHTGSEYMYTSLSLSCVALTIGFRRERDSFNEPNPGTSQSREEVCVDVTNGAVGTTITIEAIFTPGSATGTYVEVTIVTNIVTAIP